MNKRMTAAARAELADAIRPRYAAAAAKEKRKILDQFIAAAGYHEKSAIRILNSPCGFLISAARSRAHRGAHRAISFGDYDLPGIKSLTSGCVTLRSVPIAKKRSSTSSQRPTGFTP